MRDKLGEILRKKLWDDYGPQPEDGVPQPNDTDERGPQPQPQPLKLMQWVGAFVSLALVIGVVYWVFELGRRDATEVPVIQAMAGEARELPKNSGGPEVDNQGLQVNEVLASDATAPVEPETTLAPPPQPLVAEVAAPLAPMPPILVPVQTPATVAPPPAVETAQLPPSLPGADPNMVRPVRRMQAAALSDNAAVLSDAIASAILEATSVPAPVPSTAGASPAPAAASFPGETMIQFGAYDDETSANRDYDALLQDNQDLMGRLVRFVERREAGGRVFYRLRARGFTSMQEAVDMCTALLARSVQCIAVPAK